MACNKRAQIYFTNTHTYKKIAQYEDTGEIDYNVVFTLDNELSMINANGSL